MEFDCIYYTLQKDAIFFTEYCQVYNENQRDFKTISLFSQIKTAAGYTSVTVMNGFGQATSIYFHFQVSGNWKFCVPFGVSTEFQTKHHS